MARKRNQNTFEDLIDIVALFPWWVGLILAVASYFWLHYIAVAPVVVAQQGQMATVMTQSLYKGLATAGQYVLPLVCIIGALLSALGRWKRKQLIDGVNASSAVSALNEMTWQEFEMLVGEAFRRTGYTVSETGGGGADGGVDLVLVKGTEKFLVQCKQWRAYKVGVSTIRELYGVMAATGAVGGFVVTSGVFTQEAKSFAEGRNIDLIDGARLKMFIGKVQSPVAVPQLAPQRVSSKTAEQSCPKCGSEMIKRTAKHGSNAGKAFWGCSNFPQCREIVPIN
ncbi:MAG TPA: restriction endonuclease [Gallionella sp.]|nr:restriction endonuclease [Gallionella sp.]